MTEYTPPEAEFIRAYALGMRQAFIASTGEHEEEARRFLARVRRDAAREALDGLAEQYEHDAYIRAYRDAYYPEETP